MIRHLLKLVWNRKRANALVIAEILASFFVLFAVITPAVSIMGNARKPLGFEWRNIWDVRLEMGREIEEVKAEEKQQLVATLQQVMRELRTMPEIEGVAGSQTPPYSMSTRSGRWDINGSAVEIIFDEVTDEYLDVMKMKVVKGRWFRPEDDALNYQPVVLDANAAKAIYPKGDAIGSKFDRDAEREMRVVGIVEPYRKDGELSSPANTVFQRIATNGAHGRPPSHLLLRLRPNVGAEFEEKLYARMRAVAPQLAFRVRYMENMRKLSRRMLLGPLALGGLVALFLIAMVGLGLTGVLWQNVTTRARELGVRRALGASGSAVRMQVLGEVLVLATLAVIAGSIVVAQLPILGLFAWGPPHAYVAGFAGALATIYALTVLCAWYPSWLASRVTPAEALRYE
ncbi:MAG TPA: ABC transporter permease [Thermoanaerobaculia bacterium]